MIKHHTLPFIGIPLILLAGTTVADADTPPGRTPAFQHLIDCRALKDDAARLACFDRAAASLDDAVAKKEVVIVDKQQVREAKRGLFGLSLPSFHLFGRGDEQDAEEVAQIEGKIVSATPDVDGWRIKLDDGSVWTQTDGKPTFKNPKPGVSVVVRRGALGSYILRVDNAPGVKVRRVI